MDIQLWAKSFSASVNGSGIDLDVNLHPEDLTNLIRQLDEDDLVKEIGVSSLLDVIGEEAAQKHFDLISSDDYKEMENRAVAAEEKLANLSGKGKEYTDFEEL